MGISNIRFPRVLVRSIMRNRLRKIVIIQTGILVWILFQMSPFISEEDDETLLMYQPPSQSGVPDIGRKLEVNKTFRRRPSLTYLTLTEKRAEDFVIVTAASASFYPNSLEAISTVQKSLPGHLVFFYDLENREKVDEHIAQKFNALCGVTYRQFNFNNYPDHIRKLRYYSWKPIIVYEMLMEFPGVLWIDSSIRFISNNFTRIFQKAVESNGMLALTSAGHSNFAVTHPQMYSFLPTSENGMIKTDQHEANCVLLYRTRPAFENVVWWWRLCALDPHCIAPTDRVSCQDPYRSRDVHAGCHRFDQSALNILLANYFAFDYMKYFGTAIVAEVHRFSSENRELMVCLPGVERTVGHSHSYLQRHKSTASPELSMKTQESREMVVENPTH